MATSFLSPILKSYQPSSCIRNILEQALKMRRFDNLLIILILTSIFWAFRDTLYVFYVQDDFWFLKAIETTIPNQMMLTGVLPDYFRPIPTYWFFLFNKILWGRNDALLSHLVLLGIFLATVGVWHRALRRATGNVLTAALGSILYGLSPLHLYTLGWISGSIDILMAFFLVCALGILLTHEFGKKYTPILLIAFTFALLSKEIAFILPFALAFSLLVRSIKERKLPIIELKSGLVWMSGFLLSYLILWQLHTGKYGYPATAFGFDLSRAQFVLLHSLPGVIPGIHSNPPSNYMLFIPLIACLFGFVLAPYQRENLTLAASIWILPAVLIALTKRPLDLQPYQAHLSMLGLSGLIAILSTILLEKLYRFQWIGKIVIIAASLFCLSFGVIFIQRGILNRQSPSLYEARLSRAAYDQLDHYLNRGDYREVVFLDTTDIMWWAMGKGVMIPVMFPGIEAHFDGYLGFKTPPDITSHPTTLVLRQVSETQFIQVE